MSDVLTDVSDGVGTIILNRPARRNALSDDMVDGIAKAVDEMESSKQVGVIVLTGAGGAFCSGGDLRELHQSGGAHPSESLEADLHGITKQREAQNQTVGRIYHCRKPVLASMPGAAAGAGIGLALAADFRIGTPRTVFATAFANVGLAGDYGVAWLLHHVVGPAKARELLFLRSTIRGDECRELGLVNWVVPEDQLESCTRDMASQLARSPSRALEGMKQNLLRAPHEDLAASMHAEVPRHRRTGLTSEHLDAVAAFVAKEQPSFVTGWHEDP